MSEELMKRVKQVQRTLDTPCWEWQGPRWSAGYGLFRVKGKEKRAHRLSYEVFIGPVPKGLFVCHVCDNPPCINPAHLFVGTCADNNKDCAVKGRRKQGSQCSWAKLSEEQVLQIKTLLNKGVKQKEIAERFGVTPVTVHKIKTGQKWKHLP